MFEIPYVLEVIFMVLAAIAVAVAVVYLVVMMVLFQPVLLAICVVGGAFIWLNS